MRFARVFGLLPFVALPVACVAPTNDGETTAAATELVLGEEGPCGQTLLSESFPNPIDDARTVFIYVPTGLSQTPLTGGWCGDSQRPVVFYSHGAGGTFPVAYSETIDHLVSHGNIVVFSTHAIGLDLSSGYPVVDAGNVAAIEALDRADTTRVGFIGHSLGGGMLPYLVQQAESRGWGEDGLFLFALAPYYAWNLEPGAIHVPSHAHAIIEAFDDDEVVDARIGIEIFEALDLPASRKQHVTILSETHGDTELHATHVTPLTLIAPNDPLRVFGIYRNVDALEACAFLGTECDGDLSFMGTWEDDGTDVRRAISTDNPVDIGPDASQECDDSANPCECPADENGGGDPMPPVVCRAGAPISTGGVAGWLAVVAAILVVRRRRRA